MEMRCPNEMACPHRRMATLSAKPIQKPTLGKELTREAANIRYGSKADICSANRHVRFTPESGARSYISSRLMGALASSEGVLGLTAGVETSCADARRGSVEGITCAEDVGLDVVFRGGFAYCLGSDRLTPQESAIEGPAV